MTTPAPIPVALLGAGNFAKGAHLPALAATNTMVLKAVYSRSQSSAESLATAAKDYPSTAHSIQLYYDSPEVPGKGLEALLASKDIEAVILSLPIPLQPTVIEKAWREGKHVISEKPVAKDLETAKALIKLYESEYRPKGIQWIIAEQFPYEPCFAEAKKIIDEGIIGDLRGFNLGYNQMMAGGNASFETAWRKTPSYQGGFLLDGGVHFMAGLRYLLPSRITSFNGYTKLFQPHLAPSDTLHAILKTEDDTHGSVRIAWGVESTTKQAYNFFGSKGRLDIDFEKRVGGDVITTYQLVGSTVPDKTIVIKGQAVIAEFDHFGRALQGGIGSEAEKDVVKRSGPRATLEDLAFIEGCLNSDGKTMVLSELVGEYNA